MPEMIDDGINPIPPAPASVERPADINLLFGKYELRKLLGYGAFAKVYHARNIRTGQNVAIKAVSKHKVFKEGLTAQIKREISIMRRLHHSHIIQLFEVLATKTKVYFVLEYAKGGELFTTGSKGRFSEDLSRRYFQQLISAVGYCHSLGVFHRDLKPQNLLLDENWDLKVTDFGLSAVANQIQPDGLLHTTCGTPAYVAPEILAKKGYDGAKVDIWSCGIILYWLNAGYLPFNDPNLMVMYRKIYKGDFRCPNWTSPDLKHLLSRLLDTNPATRITVDEIINDSWFKKGYKRTKLSEGNFEIKVHEDDEGKYLNAFDIISLSSGVDLSGLFNHSDVIVHGERFLSAESPERIMAKIEEVAEEENVTTDRVKDWVVKLEGQNGNLVAEVEINRLTEKLVLVDIKRREGEVGPTGEIWGDRMRPELGCLVYQPERPVASN